MAAKNKNGAASNGQGRATSTTEDCSTPSSKRNGSSSTRETTTNTNGTKSSRNGSHANGGGDDKKQSASKTTQHSKIGILLRALLLDLPLVTLFALYISMLLLHHTYDEYLVPQAQLMEWTEYRKTPEITYYDRSCTFADISTNNTDDLIITANHTPTQCMHHMAQHGVSLYPSILKEETADTLRSWILKRNQVEEGFYVISGKHRYTFGIGVNQAPIVSQALREISEHPIFRPAIDEICGDNPAVIEFTAITSEYGAEDQFWHQDTLPQGSSFKHARTFVPSYSLFIPLQDTSAEIGATEICPGSHVCNERNQFCVQGGFRASGDSVWLKSTGALVNQHLYHRGMAHTDPNGLDRVLFILTFSPRPRMKKGEVETRLISMGGSYSLNWRQWGHTLDDFGNAATAMKEPWKTIKSLGLYKSKNSDWGWDLPAVASMRIVNDDNGYHVDDLEEWLQEKGGFSFLPTKLQAEFNEETGWPGFFQETLKKCEKALERLYFLASGVYLVLFMSIALYQKLSGSKGPSDGSPIVRALIRVVLTHAVVVALACYAVYSIAQTPWAQNIRHGRAHTLPIAETLPYIMEAGTLPYKRDVLAETKYDSKYLAGTNYIIENAHPGNVNFDKIVAANSVGYNGLSPALKAQLTADVVEWVGQDMGRFLTQNEEGNWAAMSIPAAQKFVHKSFIKVVNPTVANVLTELAYLISETKFGVLRDMAIHRKHIPDMLYALQDKILDPPLFVLKNTTDVTTAPTSSSSSLSVPRSFLSKVPILRDVVASVHRQYLPPPVYEIGEPYPGAWSEERDVVEAKYNGVYNEWYRGTIVDLTVDASTYDVEYDDGEVDEELCRICIRPYEPPQVDEEVEVREDGENIFYKGIVVASHADGTLDIDAGENGVFENVSPGNIRRSDPEPELKVGTRVEALYQRGKVWYDAVVTKVRADGTFDIAYDDGDKESKVKQKYIRGLT